MTTEVTTPTTSDASTPPVDDSFEAVFARIAEEDDKPAAAPEPVAATSPGDSDAGAAAAPGSAPAKAGEAPTAPPTDETPPASGAVAAPAGGGSPSPAPTTPPADTEAQLRVRIAELEAAAKPPKEPAAADAPAKEGDAAAKPDEAKPKWYEVKDDEKKLLDDYEKEWPETAKAEALRAKISAHNVIQYVFTEMQKAYGPVLQRFSELSEAMENHLALQAIQSKHSDYDEVYDKLPAWVDTLPAYAKMGAQKVMQEGNPEEVAELIDQYKKAVGATAAPTATPQTPAAPAGKKTELTEAAKKAAGKLAVVDTKRTATTTAPDAADYDAAWREATADPK